jgi:hypothetical protein
MGFSIFISVEWTIKLVNGNRPDEIRFPQYKPSNSEAYELYLTCRWRFMCGMMDRLREMLIPGRLG